MNATDVKDYRASLAFILSEERGLGLEAIGQILREKTKDGVRTLIARGRNRIAEAQRLAEGEGE